MRFKHYAFSFVSGTLLTLAFPPVFLTVTLLISFPCLLYFLGKCTRGGQAFWTGWWFGFGHHVLGLYWISGALLVDADRFAWLIPFAVSLIPAALAVYVGAVTWLLFLLPVRGVSRVLCFGALWVGAELLRSLLFTGFPWNLLGYVAAVDVRFMQSAHLWGVYGLSLVAVLLASLPALGGNNARKTLAVWSAIFLSVAALFYYGERRIVTAERTPEAAYHVRIVQANIPQRMGKTWDARMDDLMRHMQLTEQPAGITPDLIIWPESGIDVVVTDRPELRQLISSAMPKGSALVSGTVRMERVEGAPRVWNSMLFLSDRGEAAHSYDKHHLVPFGEFVPLRPLLPFLDKITEGGVDFSAGPGLETVRLSGLPAVSPLICYEAIFPGEVKAMGELPDLLVNITNDAWFGDSFGPYQHYQMARMRSVEEGIPLARAANTGISGAFDGYGRELASLPLNISGVLDVAMPPALGTEGMFYREYGDKMIYAMLGALLLFAALLQVRRL